MWDNCSFPLTNKRMRRDNNKLKANKRNHEGMIRVVRMSQEEANVIETNGEENFMRGVNNHSRYYQRMVKSYWY